MNKSNMDIVDALSIELTGLKAVFDLIGGGDCIQIRDATLGNFGYYIITRLVQME
jgi:hypothetical protein